MDHGYNVILLPAPLLPLIEKQFKNWKSLEIALPINFVTFSFGVLELVLFFNMNGRF